MVSESIRRRYLRDPLPRRLGNLAADLVRIASFADNPQHRDAVASLFEEGKFFAEWAAPDAPLDAQAMLAEVQRWLAVQHRRWLQAGSEPRMREEAQRWSDRLLESAGLI